MKKIGFISVTLNAVIPLNNYLKSEYPEVLALNYLDAGLQHYVKANGGVNEEALCRLISIVRTAISDGVQAILLTCTVFSPFVPRLNALFPDVPIIGADGAMIEQAVSEKTKLALVYTFPSTLGSSTWIFQQQKELQHKDDTIFKPFFAEGAFEADLKGNRTLHDQLIEIQMQKAESEGFDGIILAQISMAHMQRESSVPGCKIYSSLKSAMTKVMTY